jgi:hypothetical protein
MDRIQTQSSIKIVTVVHCGVILFIGQLQLDYAGEQDLSVE